MKNRILAYLDDFSRGVPNELARELKQELRLDDQTFQQNSQAVQAAILHQYTQFSISTIDAFFQKVIRSFTRESGLIGDYRLEVEHDAVLEEVIDNLIDELGSNKELTDWVVEFAKENLENERAWDVRYSLIEFAKEIFREEFKEIEDTVTKITAERVFFKQLRERLWTSKNFFLSRVSKPAQEALSIIQSNGWNAEDFSFGKISGLLTFFALYAREKNVSRMIKSPTSRIRNHFTIAANWPNKKSPHKVAIQRIADKQLVPLVIEILKVYDEHFAMALSAEVALKNLYVFGLIADIARKLKEYKDENNVMLLADAPKFLNGIIQDSDTPFIYEKVGSFYRNYLIDEFQDTSEMQWKNFQPLIANSLDQGYAGLVVGDVKQAIYRWRGGDLNLLQHEIVSFAGEQRTEVKALGQNFRSSPQVVSFNNEVFRSAAAIVSTETGTTISLEAYADVEQKQSKPDEGFVHVRFIREPEAEEKIFFADGDAEGETEIPSRWGAIALEQLPIRLEELQMAGAEPKDIAILVRKNEEGERIAAHLLQYKNSGKAKPGCRYDVVSNESLRIDGAASVNLLLGAMRYLLNPEDSVARAQLGYEFSRMKEPQRELSDVFSVSNQSIFETHLPPAFADHKPLLKKLPLIELTETLIGIFGLGKRMGELVYLLAFQDIVLEFYNRERNDLGAFLEWWEDNRHKKSVQIAGEVDAVQILTIHKSKGLQFKYVIIPFCSWNLDHDPWMAPNLWVRSEHTPFNDTGYLPVKYAKALEQTFFATYYQEEHTRAYLDNLNLLYVAFTRAEQGLIISAPHPAVRGMKISVAALLYHAIAGNETLKINWNETEGVWKSGSLVASPSGKTQNSEPLSLTEYKTSFWRDKLVARQSGATFFGEDENANREGIKYGVHMHAVLSQMKYADEIDHTLDRIMFEGLVTREERAVVRKELDELLNIPEVASWFDHSWIVHTEVPILLPDGNESRLDRLIIKDKKAIVIDFKTGMQKKVDNQQVVAYINILRQMNFIDVQGFLLYLRTNDVVEVNESGKQKTSTKIKDKDQLLLGF